MELLLSLAEVADGRAIVEQAARAGWAVIVLERDEQSLAYPRTRAPASTAVVGSWSRLPRCRG